MRRCRYCSACGQVLEDAAFSNEVTFTKGPGGESEAVGQRVTESGAVRGAGSLAGGRNHGATVRTRPCPPPPPPLTAMCTVRARLGLMA